MKIYDYEIEAKDFSRVLGRCADKAGSIGDLLGEAAHHKVEFGNADRDLFGISFLMLDIADDLDVVIKGLYSNEKTPETTNDNETGPVVSGAKPKPEVSDLETE